MSQVTVAQVEPQRSLREKLLTLLIMGVVAGVVVTPLHRVYNAAGLIVPAALGVLAGLAVAYFAATRKLNALFTLTAALMAAYFASLALRIFGELSVQEPLNVGLVTDTAAGIVRVWKDMLTLEPRFGLGSPMVLAPLLIAFLVAFLASLIALRTQRATRAVWAAIVPVAGYGLATLLGWRTAFFAGRLSIVLALVLLIWAAWWSRNFQPRRVLSLILTIGIVAAAGLVVAPALTQNAPRYVLRDELAPPFDPREFPSPLSGYRTFIKDFKETDLFTVSGLPAGTPIRLAVMDDFDGIVWNVSGAHDAEGSGAFRRIGDQLQPANRGVQHDVSFEIHSLPGPWVPTVGWLEEMRFTANTVAGQRAEVRYNDATGTALLPQGLATNTSYELTALIPTPPKDEDLTNARAGGVSLPQPENVPEAVITAAADATREASSPLGIARALEQYLQQQGWFSNGQTTVGDYPSLAGHGASRLISFFTADLMVGNDEQYASAMALMGRAAGLPTRVVMGFIPEGGEGDEGLILDDVTVQGGDVHAWVEVQFADAGWVAFFPTPPESKTPAEDTPQDTHESQPQHLQPPLPPPDRVTPPDNDTERPQTEDTTEEEPAQTSYLVWIAVGGGLGLLVLIWLAPLVFIAAVKRRRRKRRRKLDHPVDRITGGWDELVDVTFDLAGTTGDIAGNETRREFASHLITTTTNLTPPGTEGGLQADVWNLSNSADHAVFGPEHLGREHAEWYWGEVDRVTRTLRRSAPAKRRRKARRTTVSLKYRRAQRRAMRKGARK